MILVENIDATLATTDFTVPPYIGSIQEYLHLEWWEINKRILRKKTDKGTEFALRLPRENNALLKQGMPLYADEKRIIIVNVIPCEAIVVRPQSMADMGRICYEIGNKHLPLFLEQDAVMMPFERPMFQWLLKNNYMPTKETHRLTHLLRANISPHGHITQLITPDTQIHISP